MTTDPAVISAVAGDAAQARACVHAAFSPYVPRMGKPPGPMLLDMAAEIAGGRVWVVRAGDSIAGVLVQYETEEGFYIDTVAVLPASQGTGVGRALLVFAEQEARRRGHASIYLCTHATMTENQAFYPRIGYVETGRRREAGYDRVYYRKALSTDGGADAA